MDDTIFSFWIICVGVLFLFCLAVAVFGAFLLWTGRGGEGEVRYLGMVTRGQAGLACIALGLAFAYGTISLWVQSGSNLSDQRQSANVDSVYSLGQVVFFVAPALAQGSQIDDQLTDTDTPVVDGLEPADAKNADGDGEPPRTGWVYVGPSSQESAWAFSVEEGSSRSSSAMADHWIRAKYSMVVREDHYSDFAGTWVGRLFSIDEPDEICVITEGTLTRVQEEVRVGRGIIWAKIDCPTP